jgi:hypothetical protein
MIRDPFACTARSTEVTHSMHVPALGRPGLAAALLLTAPPTDRALAGWHPYLPVSNDPRVLRAECREAASFT